MGQIISLVMLGPDYMILGLFLILILDSVITAKCSDYVRVAHAGNDDLTCSATCQVELTTDKQQFRICAA